MREARRSTSTETGVAIEFFVLRYTMAALPERTPVKINDYNQRFKIHRSVLHRNVMDGDNLRLDVLPTLMKPVADIINASNKELGMKKIPFKIEKPKTLEKEKYTPNSLICKYPSLPELKAFPSSMYYRSDEDAEYPLTVTLTYTVIGSNCTNIDERREMMIRNAEPIADAIVATIKELAPVRRRITPEATTAVPNAIRREELRYNDMSYNWNRTVYRNKELFESFGVEVTVTIQGHEDKAFYAARVEVGPTEERAIHLNRLYFTQPLRSGMYARMFGVYYRDKEGGNESHIVGGFITSTHVVVLHHYIEAANTAVEKQFKKFVEEELRKTYVVHPPGSGYNVQSADLRVQDEGACQRWYVMLPYTIAKYIAGQRPLAAQTPEQVAKTAENWTKIGDWEFVKPVYDSVNRNPLKCWGDIVLENKLANIGGKTRRQRKHRSTRRRT